MFKIKLVLFFVVTVTLFTCNAMINGNPASLGQFPFVVRIRGTNNPNGDQYGICTATILTNRWLITVAHCVYDIVKIEMTAGAVDFSQNTIGSVTMIFYRTTTNIIIHPGYNPNLLWK